jgi:hypothetical protein
MFLSFNISLFWWFSSCSVFLSSVY